VAQRTSSCGPRDFLNLAANHDLSRNQMKIAVLGTDPLVLQLVAAAISAGHEIAWIGDIRSEDAAELRSLIGQGTDRAAQWELLLGHGVVDGVVVGRGAATSDLRAEQLKRLVTEAVPALAVHPLFDSVLPYYEIDMTRRETGAVIQHYNPLVGIPAVSQLAEWVRTGHPEIGTIHQVSCEHHISATTRSAVIAHLARDVELLALVIGDIRRVSAIGPAANDESFAALQVQMTATHVPSARWSVAPNANTSPGVVLTLLGDRGAITLQQSRSNDPLVSRWQIEIMRSDRPPVEELPSFKPAELAIDRFATAVTNANEAPAAGDWEAATRSMEVVDAVELSLQKGRTIEVFQQQLTEQLAFRGTMAAFGCGMLLLVFFAAFVVALLGGAEGVLKGKIAPGWPLLLLAALAFFLLLQAVPFLAKSRKADADAPPPAKN